MNNPRISARERGLIKGSLRRVFSRSDLRKEVLLECRIDHKDAKRPRVTKWGRCAECKEPTALYQMQVDHKVPLVPLDKALEDMSWDEVVDRLWCDKNNLNPLCLSCHKQKSKVECTLRRQLKKERKLK